METHTSEGVAAMRASCKLAAEILDFAGSLIEPGVTTDEIDAKVHDRIIERGAYPSPLGYSGFPKSMCASVNEVICHGIPDTRPLEEGDILKIDVSVYLGGHHGDTCRTWVVGTAPERTLELAAATKESLDTAITLCGPDVPFNYIGACIEEVVRKAGLDSVREFSGHGVGKIFHTLPQVVHFKSADYGVMRKDTTFTIEPMITAGSAACYVRDDNWAVATRDGSLAAQFEHTLLVTDDGVDVLTAYE